MERKKTEWLVSLKRGDSTISTAKVLAKSVHEAKRKGALAFLSEYAIEAHETHVGSSDNDLSGS